MSIFFDHSHQRAVGAGFRETAFLKHVKDMEDNMADRLAKSVRERTEPLHMIITAACAKVCRDAVQAAQAELPEDHDQARKLLRKSPKSGLGTMIQEKASLDELAVYVAKRCLERWVRALKPFASGPGLSALISRLVYEEFRRPRMSSDTDHVMRLAPPDRDPLGAALRGLTPTLDKVAEHPWIFIEDLEAALNLESQFNITPDHPLRPNSPHRKPVPRSSSAPSVPTSENTQSLSPKGCSAGVRRSGAFPWGDFQEKVGFRQTATTLFPAKQIRKFPGPAHYGHVVDQFTAPQRATWGRFPSVGDRRTRCTSTPLSCLGRFWEDEYRIPK